MRRALSLLVGCLLAACAGEVTDTTYVPDAAAAADVVATPADAAPADAAPADAAPADAAPTTVRLMTYNIKHGAVTSLESVAAVILAEQADVVALQEVDNGTDRADGVDQAARLGELTSMGSAFAAAINYGGGQYGLALLSRYPIVASEKTELTTSGEQRILLVADLSLDDGRTMHFAVTHLSLDAGERATEANEILTRLSGLPLVTLSGDLNESPGGAATSILDGVFTDVWPAAGEGDGWTFPADVPDRRIDFVFLSSDFTQLLEAHVPDTTASDHRPIVTTVVLPPG